MWHGEGHRRGARRGATMSFERTKDPLARALGTIEMQVRRFYRPSIWNAPGGHESSAGQIPSHVFQWCAETLLTHSDSRSPGAELLMSPRLRMPIIRLLLFITGNLRTCSCSMCRTALTRPSSSRQQCMPGVITSRAAPRRAPNLAWRHPLPTDSHDGTLPLRPALSP